MEQENENELRLGLYKILRINTVQYHIIDIFLLSIFNRRHVFNLHSKHPLFVHISGIQPIKFQRIDFPLL